MKASEVIERLQEMIAVHGDLPVNTNGGDIRLLEPYDKWGGHPDGLDRPAVEFFIHS
jgi:hypothetical protein